MKMRQDAQVNLEIVLIPSMRRTAAAAYAG
jgi:hypothetical protein